MRELGFDFADRTPRLLERAQAEWADVVVTMGCGDECRYVPGKRYLDWDDPKGLSAGEVRAVPDQIDQRIEELLREVDYADSGSESGD